MVARSLEHLGQAREDAPPVVGNRGGLAVHDLRGPHDPASEDLTDALVARADPEHGKALPAELGDGKRAHAGLFRPSRPGRNEQGGRLEGLQAGDVDGIVADHDRLGPELSEVLDQVVDEAVVVVDHRHLDASRSARLPAPRFIGILVVRGKGAPGSDEGTSSKKKPVVIGPGYGAEGHTRSQQALHGAHPEKRPPQPTWFGPVLLVAPRRRAVLIVGNYVGIMPASPSN